MGQVKIRRKKAQQRLYFLWQFKSSATKQDRAKLQRMTRPAERISEYSATLLGINTIHTPHTIDLDKVLSSVED
ncbi:hypothetical protein AMECASPLE_035005 [Ameca splendens]|uniref:Uncharacterized protein n=1 Tax=Ameca splendens TaxID=208324 RepID=A0ABV0YJ92_9TELE